LLKVALVGLGKMGLSHHAIINSHPDVEMVAICDSSAFVLGVLSRYTGIRTFSDYEEMLDELELDALIIATPSRSHASMVREALDRGIHVFCEKPFTLSAADSDALAQLADDKGLVTQVGYHNRFVGAFQEVARLVEAGAIGRITHARGEAYGPVILQPRGSTWRTLRHEGGGCLYDYAAHPIDLINWYCGAPVDASGSVLGKLFSKETEDEVYSTLRFADGATAQLSVNWSDETHRKMTTQVTLWGTGGRIYADRQEIQVYLRDTVVPPLGYQTGWNVRYTTELTAPVWFYLRGEEYSAQLDHFVQRALGRVETKTNDFTSAARTDRVIDLIIDDAQDEGRSRKPTSPRRSMPSRGGFASRPRVRPVVELKDRLSDQMATTRSR
jgi:scyllo-inositol 2-dehydrogenase (NADP+)